MAELFKNPFYHLHTKVMKLEGPHKAMLVGEWNDSVTNLLWNTDPTLTPRGMLNFYPHCDNALFATLFPAAAAPDPPANIRLVPVPQQAPDIPFDSPLDMHKLQEIQNKRFERYTSAMNTIWYEVIASLDDSIYSVLKSMAGTNNIRKLMFYKSILISTDLLLQIKPNKM
jgi:hypothetical protein